MKTLFLLLIIISFATITGIAQPRLKTTYLNILEDLAVKEHLELIYSPDLVSLLDSTDFPFSTNIDSCLMQLQDVSNFKITQTETHLITKIKSACVYSLARKSCGR
ncbi:hypothetical protein [Maribellus maritimus]|uniref:hypothetical protein n=1 Tax=Maribellus maritimus TaxID=2870838 RepID=UPI001EEB4565|nr:hypothetical protein [Maribellus maritimus]MCG6190167.1 hypothetical protein [Maribellus maritimus]